MIEFLVIIDPISQGKKQNSDGKTKVVIAHHHQRGKGKRKNKHRQPGGFAADGLHEIAKTVSKTENIKG